jgi:hypothetical protein
MAMDEGPGMEVDLPEDDASYEDGDVTIEPDEDGGATVIFGRDIESLDVSSIGFGDNKKLPVQFTGSIGSLDNVQVVKGMPRNLVSASSLAQDNNLPILLTESCAFICTPGTKFALKKANILMEVPVVNGLYEVDTAELWTRLGAIIPDVDEDDEPDEPDQLKPVHCTTDRALRRRLSVVSA